MAAPESRLDGDPVARIDSLHHDISSRQRAMLRAVAEHDRTEAWRRDGCRDMAQWLSGRLGISNWTARRWVHAAHALESLPLTSNALETGALGLDKAVELARLGAPETEKELIAWARRVSPAAIRRKADAATRASLDDVRAAEHARYLQWWWFDDGKRMGLEGEFPAAQGATIAKALARVAARIPEMPKDELHDGGEPCPEARMDQRRADALWALASGAIAADPDPDRATVVVHTTLDSVTGAEVEGGPVIHPETTARLACDARLQYVLTDRAGNALGIGHTARDIPAWMMRSCATATAGARSQAAA